MLNLYADLLCTWRKGFVIAGVSAVKMPIQVKDYLWQETDKTVLISVPLKGVHPSKVDIVSTDDYLKVSYQNDKLTTLCHRP